MTHTLRLYDSDTLRYDVSVFALRLYLVLLFDID